jgi:hypothetical protein
VTSGEGDLRQRQYRDRHRSSAALGYNTGGENTAIGAFALFSKAKLATGPVLVRITRADEIDAGEREKWLEELTGERRQ